MLTKLITKECKLTDGCIKKSLEHRGLEVNEDNKSTLITLFKIRVFVLFALWLGGYFLISLLYGVSYVVAKFAFNISDGTIMNVSVLTLVILSLGMIFYTDYLDMKESD